MEKTRLNRFVQKYNLNGNAEQVKWSFKGDKLITDFVTEDKSLKGTIVMNNMQFDDMDIGIYDTAQLQRLLSVLGEDISVDINRVGDRAVALNIKNGSVSVDFNLSDLSIIPSSRQMKRIPEFNTQIKIDSKFIETFVKGKVALPDSQTFTIVNRKDVPMIIIGYAKTNTNRVNIPVETLAWDIDDAITFNAELFKEILVANKECTSAILEVSTAGLARINFKVDDYDSTYYIVATQGVD
tara:strand:+ start:52 stop:771 length:720 start_codon:yes stop_codon:yes gene_type:complete